jgi:hypothetical protein
MYPCQKFTNAPKVEHGGVKSDLISLWQFHPSSPPSASPGRYQTERIDPTSGFSFPYFHHPPPSPIPHTSDRPQRVCCASTNRLDQLRQRTFHLPHITCWAKASSARKTGPPFPAPHPTTRLRRSMPMSQQWQRRRGGLKHPLHIRQYHSMFPRGYSFDNYHVPAHFGPSASRQHTVPAGWDGGEKGKTRFCKTTSSREPSISPTKAGDKKMTIRSATYIPLHHAPPIAIATVHANSGATVPSNPFKPVSISPLPTSHPTPQTGQERARGAIATQGNESHRETRR